MQVDKVIGFKFKGEDSEITPNTAIIYALGLGFSKDPLEDKDLQYTYELHSDFKVFPTIGTVLHNSNPFEAMTSCPGFPQFNPMMLLHAEQRLEFHSPLQVGQKIRSEGKISDVADKGKAALITFEIDSFDKETNKKLFTNQMKLFIRGIGGFGYKGAQQKGIPQKPNRKPDLVCKESTSPNQAIVYRLSGDTNPLHIDPNMAAMGGFDKPILHGLCFYGLASKVVCQQLLDNDPTKIKAVQSRFTGSVFPGETLVVSLWKEGNLVIFQAETEERKKECIVGVVELDEQPKPKL